MHATMDVVVSSSSSEENTPVDINKKDDGVRRIKLREREVLAPRERRPTWLPEDWVCAIRPRPERSEEDGKKKRTRCDIFFYEKKTGKRFRSQRNVRIALGLPVKERKKRKPTNDEDVAQERPAETIDRANEKKKRKRLPDRLTLKWQRDLRASAPQWAQDHVQDLILKGFTCIRKTLDKDTVDRFMNATEEKPSSSSASSYSSSSISQSKSVDINGNDNDAKTRTRPLRKRSDRQIWRGAVRTIRAHVKTYTGGAITVLAPAVERSHGRYDYPLHPNIVRDLGIVPILNRGPFALIRHMIGDSLKASAGDESSLTKAVKKQRLRGRVSTHNVMLSTPGSALQPTHTDSRWTPRTRSTNPRPHYYTVLVALSRNDAHTGGTLLYPGTHRDSRLEPEDVESLHLDLEPGDALIFDGLLLHRGMPNLSGTPGHGEARDRYMYYTVITTSKVDQNTRVTGV